MEKDLGSPRGADGQWTPTKAGLAYFKFARDEFVVTVGAFRVARDQLVPSPPQTLSEKRFTAEYIANPEARLAFQRLNTPEEQIRFVKNAVYNFIDTLPTIIVGGNEYKVLHYDSTPVVWDNKKTDITYSRMRIQFYDDGAPADSNEVVLNRPLLDYTIPPSCWRPFDLHANCLRKLEAGCGVQMIHDCYIITKTASGVSM